TPDRPDAARGWLFGLATFTAAALLFAVQPMVARRLLPALGGAPAVWTTCVLFFQAGLVGGYALAHGLARASRPALQGVAYVGLLAAGLALSGPDPTPDDLGRLARSSGPVAGLLALLAGWVGLPYVMLSAASPLLQRWFGGARRDPYVLYAASNAGSLLALAAYPLWVERAFPTAEQLHLWRLGLGGFAALAALCAFVATRGAENLRPSATVPFGPRARDAAAWASLAFVPSAGLLAVTAHLTTDLAAAPLLWVIPLGLYLISMIAAFSEAGRRALPAAGRLLPALLVPTALVLAVGLVQWFWVPLHLIAFAVGAFVVHGALAERRPAVDRLTAYYLAIAVGGALGGVFCALIAPRVFDRPVEYPLSVVAVGLVLAWTGRARGAGESPGLALIVPAVVGLTTALLVSGWGGLADGPAGPPLTMLASGLALLAFATPRARPLRFALTLGALLAAGGFATGVNGRVLLRER
ncbi:MAG: hypothetical protein K2X91_14435, partial [Thermoleophilia bacterium]|nr:hypothetical protein [Thermoleophilia bacterium]